MANKKQARTDKSVFVDRRASLPDPVSSDRTIQYHKENQSTKWLNRFLIRHKERLEESRKYHKRK